MIDMNLKKSAANVFIENEIWVNVFHIDIEVFEKVVLTLKQTFWKILKRS